MTTNPAAPANEDIGLFEAIENCRAMRRIAPDEVDPALITRVIRAAQYGPSAGNRQNDHWLVVTDPAKRARLAELNRAAVDLLYPPFPEDGKESAFQWQYNNLQDIPVHVIACLHLEHKRDDFDGGVAAGGSIWGKVQNLLLAARALGLGACPTTLPLIDRAAVAEVLGLPADVEAIALIPIGTPMGRFGPVTRAPVEQVIHHDTW